jgi:citrate synthase
MSTKKELKQDSEMKIMRPRQRYIGIKNREIKE